MFIFVAATFALLLYILAYINAIAKLPPSGRRAAGVLAGLWILAALSRNSDLLFVVLGLTLLIMPISILVALLSTNLGQPAKTQHQAEISPIDAQLRKAVLLSVSVKNAYLANVITQSRYEFLNACITRWIVQLCAATGDIPKNPHKQQLNDAWQAAEQALDQDLGKPFWLFERVDSPAKRAVVVPNAQPPVTKPVETLEVVEKTETSEAVETVLNSASETPQQSPQTVARVSVAASAQTPVNTPVKTAAQATVKASVKLPQPVVAHEEKKLSVSPLQPAKPEETPDVSASSAAAEALKTAFPVKSEPPLPASTKSRLSLFFSEILWRFLWQNIGWFIGGFCFVSGSVFLVAYSSGYSKALAVLGTLSLYAALLFWGGYLIRRKRQHLETVSQVLLILGALLIPLIFATATRLISHNQSLLPLSVLLGLLSVIGAAFAVRLASGMMDRALLQDHPRWFIALALMQFFAPLLSLVNHWYALAALHFSLLIMLGFALNQFTQRWLHHLFIDQRKLSYYAAGTLIYAALISFIHLTWSNDIALPAGYNGIFLMLLSLLLFNVDRHLKQWVEKKAWLDRFSFVIYALSMFALLSAWLPTWGNGLVVASGVSVLPLAITLALGALLYGLMLWHYLTLPPLYLLLLACAGEYALLLRPFPAEAHFLLSIPGFAALLLLRRFLLKRNAQDIAQRVSNVLIGLIAALVLWSLWQAQPGWTAMFTPLSAALIMLPVLGISVAQLLDKQPASRHCYLLSAFIWLTLAYAPVFLGTWALQFSLTLLAVSWLWGLATLSVLRHPRPRCHANVFMNSSLLSIGAALALTAYWLPTPQLAWMCVPAGGILLLFGWWFNSRVFIYATLLSFAAATFWLFQHYQISTTGSSTLALGIAFFIVVARLKRLSLRPTTTTLADFQPAEPADAVQLSPLRLWTIRHNDYHNRAAMLLQPLEHAMFALWSLGLLKLLQHLAPLVFNDEVNQYLGLNVPELLSLPYFLGAWLTILIAGHYRQLKLLSLALILLMSSILLFADPLLTPTQLSVLVIALSLLSWRLTLHLALRLDGLWQLLDWKGGYDAEGGRWQMEKVLHHTAFALIALALWLPLSSGGLQLLLSLSLAIAFWALAGQRYQYPLHAYLVVGGVSLWLLSIDSLFADVRLWLYFNQLERGWLLTVLSLGLAVLGGWVTDKNPTDLPSTPFKARENRSALSIDVYKLPLYHFAYLLYTLAIITVLVFNPWLKTLDEHSLSFSLLLLTQSLVLLPLLRSPDHAWLITPQLAAHLRGVLMPILLSLALVNLLLTVLPLGNRWGLYLLIGWAFALWAWAKYHKPMPSYPIASGFAPWWGLFMMLYLFFAPLLHLYVDHSNVADLLSPLPKLLAISLYPTIYSLFMLQIVNFLTLASLAVYLVLMLQTHPAMLGLRWSAAVAVFLTGLLAALKLFPLGLSLNPLLVLGVLIWLNVLLHLSKDAQASPDAQTWRNQLPLQELSQLSIGLLMVFLITLAIPTLFLVIKTALIRSYPNPPSLMSLSLSLLLSLSFAHLYYIKANRIYAHWLIFAVSTTLALLLVGIAGLPLLLWLAAWLWLAMVSEAWAIYGEPTDTAAHSSQQIAHTHLKKAIEAWIIPMFCLALITLFSPLSTSTQLLGLALLGGFASVQGFKTEKLSWLLTGISLLFIALHWVWLMLLPNNGNYSSLLPWYALQSVLLARLTIEVQQRLTKEWAELLDSLPLLPILLLLSFSEWWLYLWMTFQSLARTGAMLPTLFGMFDTLVMSLTVFLLFMVSLRRSSALSETGIYLHAANFGLLALLLRWIGFGLYPPTAWDTAAILSVTALLVILSHAQVIKSPQQQRAVQNLILITPVLALLILPSFVSTHGSLTLFITTVLYWLMRRDANDQPISVYLGLLALNLSVYLWIPSVAQKTGLVQIYVLPISLSILMMLQLHWLELKPSVAHAVRLTTLTAIYLSATLDVFLRPDFSVFLLALGLSLGGVLLGIALRIRAFLYAGTSFLIFNVIGQIVQNYPQAMLSKAIVLMALGGTITGGMIVFQLQKEAILRWISRAREDLQAWA